MQLERCAPPSVWAPLPTVAQPALHRMAADMSVCRLCFRQASNLVATDVDEQPIAQATRTTHFEDENSTAMEVGDAESLGLGEPVGGVADLENAAAEASPALTLAVVLSLATGMFAVGPDAPMAEVRRSRSRWPQLRSPQLGKKGSFSMGRLPPQTDEIANSTMALPELAQLAAARSILATVPLLI